jgi:hypothetical protein
MSSQQERKALKDEMRMHLDLWVRDWVFELYNHGVRFNEVHQALVHYREPWVELVFEGQRLFKHTDGYFPAQASSIRQLTVGKSMTSLVLGLCLSRQEPKALWFLHVQALQHSYWQTFHRCRITHFNLCQIMHHSRSIQFLLCRKTHFHHC